MKYVFKTIFSILAIVICFFSIKETIVIKDDVFIQNEINKHKIKDIKDENLSNDKIKDYLYQSIRNMNIKVYDLGLKGLFVKEFKINHLDNNKFNIQVNISGGILGIILSLIIILLTWARELGILSINFYQKNLSNKKGYCCARGVVSEDGTCSSITKDAFEKDGFIAGMKEYSNTTKKCKEDFETYNENKEHYDYKRKKKNKSNNLSSNDDLLLCSVCGAGVPDVGSC